ncbi:hypothetical protein OOK60_06265 [Trichothermofontia sichuanensis B231]|uniref:hypothetical protein n=1 Tax=Trichothermofontia sichuanensis TaxID=3045816 RepID=UPI0022486B86|nr:hypothetical protein OOK60_06265 [Trichothermofontia sichuanensis B231]
MVSQARSRKRSSNGLSTSLQAFWEKRRGDILPPLIGILAFLTIWQLFSWSGLMRLPGPLSLWTDQRTRGLLLYPFYDLGGLNKGLFWQTLASLGRVAQGYTLAAIVGISMGVLVGTNKILHKSLDPIFQFLRMVAPLAWVPIALVVLQQNQATAIFVIFITSVWPILINTTEGGRTRSCSCLHPALDCPRKINSLIPRTWLADPSFPLSYGRSGILQITQPRPRFPL